MEHLLLLTYIVGVPLFTYNAYNEIANKEAKLSDSKYARWLMAIFMVDYVLDGLLFFIEYFQ